MLHTNIQERVFVMCLVIFCLKESIQMNNVVLKRLLNINMIQQPHVCERFNVFCRNNVSRPRTQIKAHRVKPNDLPMGVRDVVLCNNSIDFFGIIQVGVTHFYVIF